jgi:elongation factor Ts
MAEITASLVKQLRDKTGAGMMDCKKALIETDADVEQAIDWLRKNGLAAAAKKAGRIAAEGLVGLAVEGARGAVVEINSETDFVARNEDFQGFVRDVAGVALAAGGDVAAIGAADYPSRDRSVAEELTELVGKIGENIVFRRRAGLSVETGVVASYVHNSAAPGLGKIGVLVALESSADPEALNQFGRQLAMHVAATRPEAVTRDEVDPSTLDREREILADQARAAGKPENIVEKMVEGRLRKYYEEVVLSEQIFVIDNETRIDKAVEEKAKELGAPIAIKGFIRFELGEGVEKDETDFAAEVAAQLKD